jgi:hypothetical protein
MTSDDIDYYRERAAAELELAKATSNPYARRAHQELAENYVILCRLLSPNPLDLIQPRDIDAHEISFTTLVQTLAHPHGGELYHAHGRPADHAPLAEVARADPRREPLRIEVPFA